MILTSKERTLFPLIAIGIFYLNAVSCDEHDAAIRNKKQFSLFSVVTFPNEECTSESTYNGGAVTGTCYSTTECTDKAGTKSGNCAAGFGVCCIFMYSLLTSKTISENRTYFQNPLYPSIETSGAGTTWTYTISKMRSDICQLRLDFETFVITGPISTGEYGIALADGNCGDKLTTTLSGGAQIPVLCGVMTGHHIYMDMGMESSDTATLAMSLVATSTTTYALAYRQFRVKTSQIPCWASYRAPEGCNQYFTSHVGQIVSPNFSKTPAGTGGSNLLNSGQDLMSQDLKYCIRRERNTCCILYQVCNQYGGIDLTVAAGGGVNTAGDTGWISEGWSFHTKIYGAGGILGSALAAANLGDATNDLGVVDAQCSGDYIEIPDSSMGKKNYGATTVINTRYCGHRFGYIPAITAAVGDNNHSPVWDCTEPFEVRYRTDQMNDIGVQATAQTTDNNRGVCLDFTQDKC
jgi:hypothetical protein